MKQVETSKPMHRGQKSILHRIEVGAEKDVDSSASSPDIPSNQYPLILSLINSVALAPVAKLDKAPVYETGDYRFESCRARHIDDRLQASPLNQQLHA